MKLPITIYPDETKIGILDKIEHVIRALPQIDRPFVLVGIMDTFCRDCGREMPGAEICCCLED